MSALAGCAVSHGVKPLAKGEGAIQASMGGPISRDLPTPVPFVVPITTIGYAHGVSDRVSVHGAIHPTSLGALGVFGMDAGATTLVWDADGAKPRLMIDSTLVLYGGDNKEGGAPGGTRVYPMVEGIASWDLGNHALYVGLNNFAQLFPTPSYHLTPEVGGLLSLGRVDLQLEYKWMSFYRNNELTTAEFVGPGGLGASSIQLGMGIHLGKARSKKHNGSDGGAE